MRLNIAVFIFLVVLAGLAAADVRKLEKLQIFDPTEMPPVAALI